MLTIWHKELPSLMRTLSFWGIALAFAKILHSFGWNVTTWETFLSSTLLIGPGFWIVFVILLLVLFFMEIMGRLPLRFALALLKFRLIGWKIFWAGFHLVGLQAFLIAAVADPTFWPILAIAYACYMSLMASNLIVEVLLIRKYRK